MCCLSAQILFLCQGSLLHASLPLVFLFLPNLRIFDQLLALPSQVLCSAYLQNSAQEMRGSIYCNKVVCTFQLLFFNLEIFHFLNYLCYVLTPHPSSFILQRRYLLPTRKNYHLSY